MFGYRLALDVGTASLGIVALSLNEVNFPVEPIYSKVYIFSEPLLPAQNGGIGAPKKAARIVARQQRRLIERRARRLRRIAHLGSLLGINSKNIPSDSGQTIHRLRAQAISQRVELEDLLNIMLKIAKKRGYAGGFKVKKDDEDSGQVESGIKALESQLSQNNHKTIGQLLDFKFGEPGKLGTADRQSLKLKNIQLYAHRDMLEDEFDAIWKEQENHHPLLKLKAEAYSVRGQVEELPIKQHFKEAIFFQRPLKSVAGMVGQCSLEPTLPRAPAAQPAAQTFRIEKQLADLRWGMGRHQKKLSSEQKTHIRALLNNPEELTQDGSITFQKIYKSLEKASLRSEFPSQFNSDRFSRETLIGNKTSKVMQTKGMHTLWQTSTILTQKRILNFIANLGSPEAVDSPNWQTRLKPSPTKEVVDFINQWLEKGTFDRMSKMGFDSGRSAYSIKALERINAHLMQTVEADESSAINSLYPQDAPTGELLMHLPAPQSTGNVVVDVALRVVRRGINECLTALGKPPQQVIVELSREMAMGLKARGEKELEIAKNRKKRIEAKREIESHNPGRTASNNDIFRYLLWSEQDSHCPYCSQRIQLSEVLDGNATNVDHILPRSLTQVKRLRSHLVIAHRTCNAEKGDRVPMEAFKGQADRVSAIENCAQILKKKRSSRKAGYLLTESYEAEKLNDRSLEDFTERQFVESSWIAKLTAQWMKAICTDVSVSRGELTAQLRKSWKLDTVIAQVRLETKVNADSEATENHLPIFDEDKPPKKISREEFDRFRAHWENHHGSHVERTDRRIDKRIDHRHHLVDALVIGLTDRKLYRKMAEDYKARMELIVQGRRDIKPWITPEPPIDSIRQIALDLVRSVEVHHKTDRYVGGALYQKTAYAKDYTDDGKSRLITHVELLDLTDEKFSLDKARKSISDIVSTDTRRVVQEEFERRIESGLEVKAALETPIFDHRYGTQIKKVRIYQRLGRGYASGEDAIKITHVPDKQQNKSELLELSKYYLSDGYAYVAIIRQPETDSLDVVSVGMPNTRIFDLSRIVRRIYRGDTVIDEKGSKHIVHQILADGVIRTAPTTETRSWIQLGAEAGAKSFGKAAVLKLKRQE